MNEVNASARLFNRELKLRVISALLLAAFVLLITWIGGYTFVLLCSVVAFAIFYEYSGICSKETPGIIRSAGYAGVALTVIAYSASSPVHSYWIAAAAFGTLAFWELLVARSLWVCFGLAYSVLPFFAMCELRESDFLGFVLILVLFGSVWGADILAYFFGKMIGGPKLAPKISPKKTWSGFVGALIGGAGLASAVIWFTDYRITGFFLLIVLALVVVSQIGDLIESSLKRRFDIKDSGKIIPGHGGILDRIDGLIMASILLWLVLLFLRMENGSGSTLGTIFQSAILAP